MTIEDIYTGSNILEKHQHLLNIIYLLTKPILQIKTINNSNEQYDNIVRHPFTEKINRVHKHE